MLMYFFYNFLNEKEDDNGTSFITEFNASAVARAYYDKVEPEKNYTNKQAYLRFKTDRKIKVDALNELIKELADKQIERNNYIKNEIRKQKIKDIDNE